MTLFFPKKTCPGSWRHRATPRRKLRVIESARADFFGEKQSGCNRIRASVDLAASQRGVRLRSPLKVEVLVGSHSWYGFPPAMLAGHRGVGLLPHERTT